MTKAKRSLISNIVLVAANSENKVKMLEFESRTQEAYEFDITEWKNSDGTPAVLFAVADRLNEILDDEDVPQQIGIVIPDDAARKIFMLQKDLNKSLKVAKEHYRQSQFSWMSEEWVMAMDTMADTLNKANKNGVVIAAMRESSLYYWDITAAEDAEIYDGMEITLKNYTIGGEKISATDENGSIACESNYVTGTFKVHEHKVGKMLQYRIERVLGETSVDDHIANLRMVMNYVRETLPRVRRMTQMNIKRKAA